MRSVRAATGCASGRGRASRRGRRPSRFDRSIGPHDFWRHICWRLHSRRNVAHDLSRRSRRGDSGSRRGSSAPRRPGVVLVEGERPRSARPMRNVPAAATRVRVWAGDVRYHRQRRTFAVEQVEFVCAATASLGGASRCEVARALIRHLCAQDGSLGVFANDYPCCAGLRFSRVRRIAA